MWKPYTVRQPQGAAAATVGFGTITPFVPEIGAHAPASSEEQVSRATVALLLAAIGYNAILAVINAHVAAMSITQVAMCEFLILAMAAALILSRGLQPLDRPSIALGIGTLLGSITLSIVNQAPVAAMLRNVAIMVVFTMLGIRCNRATMRACFLTCLIVVGAVMALEIISTRTYSTIFNPFSYYLNTRSLGDNDFDDTGLFGNSLGFEGRFSFGIFSTPRTSSIFLEQTSLANFASFCVIYILSLWTTADRREKILGILFIVIALVSNNTRTASTLTMICAAGYFLFPLLPRFGTLILPLLMIGMAFMANASLGESKEDDLAGRIGLSITMLKHTDFYGLLGTQAANAAERFPDSGYSYTLYAASIFGAIALWLYIALIVPATSAERKRCAWGIGLFLFMNLLISGNATYSVKIAAPLWLLAGFMRTEGFRPKEHTRASQQTLEPA